MFLSGLQERHLRFGHQGRFQVPPLAEVQKPQVERVLQLLRDLQWKGNCL